MNLERLPILRVEGHMQECPAVAPSCREADPVVVEDFDVSCAKNRSVPFKSQTLLCSHKSKTDASSNCVLVSADQ